MTYKEKLMKEEPNHVNDKYMGGCEGCPGTRWKGAPDLGLIKLCADGPSEENCRKCWNTEIPGTKPTTEIDIHKIIDDAMEKKDRSVMIFIGKYGMTVHVDPLNNTKPRWTMHKGGRPPFVTFECSECGARESSPTPYCSRCGEQMLMPKEAKDDENSEKM